MKELFSFHIEKEEFIKEAVKTDRMLLRAMSILMIFIEGFNIFRVLFLSNSGLATLNNRIYFGFYCVLVLCAVMLLMTDSLINMSMRVKYTLYMAAASVFVLWQTLFNMYDIYRADAVGNITAITALVIFSALFMMRPLYAFLNLIVNYVIFTVFLVLNLSSGEVINYTITALLCCAIYFVRYKHTYIEFDQSKKIKSMNKELEEAKYQFRLSQEQYEQIREKSEYITFEWNIRSGRIRFSKEWTQWFGQPENIDDFEDYIKRLKSLTEEQKEEVLLCMANIKNGVHYQRHEFLIPVKSGRKRWFELRVVVQEDGEANPEFGIGIISDVTGQKEYILRLEQESSMDLFTETLNKTAIEDYGERILKNLCEGEKMLMLILDMDNFKYINDNFGHPAGDWVLQEVAKLMKFNKPAGAKIGRLGGDEFIVLAVDNEVDGFYAYAQNIVKAVAKLRGPGGSFGAGCSIGIAAADFSEKLSYEQLYKAADRALYKSKKLGKGQVFFAG